MEHLCHLIYLIYYSDFRMIINFIKLIFTAKVPSIEIADNVCIYESLVTVEYLDEMYPQRPLLPKDPLKRAFDKIIIEAIGPVSIWIMYKTSFMVEIHFFFKLLLGQYLEIQNNV